VPVYLAWLRDRLIDLGGRFEIVDQDLEAIPTDRAPVVVNCAGMGARRLVDDPSLTPVRGQVVVVRNPGLDEGILVESGPDSPIYVLPRGTDCVLGGTADEGDERLDPDPETTEAILAKCAAIEPSLSGAEVIEVKVGLRPARPAVRVEAEQLPGGVLLIHDYGHGGAGFTLSWGCADEVVVLASAAAEPRAQGAVEKHVKPRVPSDTGGVGETWVSEPTGTQVGIRAYDSIGDGIWAKGLVQRIGGNLQVRRGEAIDVLELPGLVATIAARPVGIVTYRRDGEECELALLVSEDDGRGVGTALIEALAAASAGCRRIWVVTTNDNLRALRFYQRRGFRLAQIRPGAVDQARQTLKPQIPLIGADGIPLRDEIELELILPGSPTPTRAAPRR
jgi:GNAT superfamily N-acetyltransferase